LVHAVPKGVAAEGLLAFAGDTKSAPLASKVMAETFHGPKTSGIPAAVDAWVPVPDGHLRTGPEVMTPFAARNPL
jgi:hypothetical protein